MGKYDLIQKLEELEHDISCELHENNWTNAYIGMLELQSLIDSNINTIRENAMEYEFKEYFENFATE